MTTSSTSGGFLITFMLVIVSLIIVATIAFRLKYPVLWRNSVLAKLYRPEHHNGRLVLLVVVGAVVALTVCLPRWTRSSAIWSDSFTGQSMFMTCTCIDPSVSSAAGCNADSQTVFRAVQGFSVLGLMCYFLLAVAAGFGSKLELDGNGGGGGGDIARNHDDTTSMEPSQNNTNNNNNAARFEANGRGVVVRVDANNNNNQEGGESNNSPREGNAAATSLNVVAVAASSNSSSSSKSEPLADAESMITVANRACLILLPIAWFCSLCSWAIFATVPGGCTSPGWDLGATSLHWGWVFRLFEWFFISALAIVFVVRYFHFATSFNFSLDRLHFFSLLILGLSSLTTTTQRWSLREQGGTSKISSEISPFFACTCTPSSCAQVEGAQSAQLAFYVLFLVFAILRNFYHLGQTNVWMSAFGSTIRDVVLTPTKARIDGILSARVQGFVAVGVSTSITAFLLIALLIMSGVLAAAECGAGFDRFTSDIGLVSHIFVLCICTVETSVTIVDVFIDGSSSPSDAAPVDDVVDGNEKQQVPPSAEPHNQNENENNNNDANFTDLRTEEEKRQQKPQQNTAPAPPLPPVQQNNVNNNNSKNQSSSIGHKKTFSNASNGSSSPAVLAPPPPPIAASANNNNNTNADQQQQQQEKQSKNNNNGKKQKIPSSSPASAVPPPLEEKQLQQEQQKKKVHVDAVVAEDDFDRNNQAASAQVQPQVQVEEVEGESEEHPPFSPAGDAK
jgi:hypothetical protein